MHKLRVLILTPLALEYQAIVKNLVNCHHYVHEKAAYTLGEFAADYNEYKVLIREPGPLPVEMALATNQAIQHFDPQIALLVGVAGGLKDVALGDVLIADKVYSYEGGKEDRDGFKARPTMGTGSKDLLAHAQVLSKSEHWKARTLDGASGARIFFGAIASGSIVVASNDNQTYKNIKKYFNDSLGIEMEAYGFSAALQFHPQIHGLVIRGISDLCQGKDGASDERWQPLAAERASAVVFELLHKMDCSTFILIPIMKEILSLATKIISIVSPFLRNRVFQKIGTDLSEATTNEGLVLWEKIKPIFIEEDEKKVVQQVEQQPDDADAVEALKFFLIQKLKQQQNLRNEIEQILAIGQNGSQPSTQMTHYGTGDQFTGNKTINYQSEPKV